MAENFPKNGAKQKPNVISNPSIQGRNNFIDPTAENVICFGDRNSIGYNVKDSQIFNSSGCIIPANLRNVSILNSSGVIATRNDVCYNNNNIISPVSGGYAITNVNTGGAAYSVLPTDEFIKVTTDTFGVTIQLPDARLPSMYKDGFGKRITIQRMDSTDGIIQIAAGFSQLIDGLSYQYLIIQYDCITIQSNGTGWDIVNFKYQYPSAELSDSTTQSIADITLGQAITFNTDEYKNGILHNTGANPSRIYVLRRGYYHIHMEAQTDTANANKQMYFWLRKNGTDVDRSTTTIKMVNSNDQKSLTLTYNYYLIEGDYIEIYMGGTSTGCSLPALASSTVPTRPATPSVILTIDMI